MNCQIQCMNWSIASVTLLCFGVEAFTPAEYFRWRKINSKALYAEMTRHSSAPTTANLVEPCLSTPPPTNQEPTLLQDLVILWSCDPGSDHHLCSRSSTDYGKAHCKVSYPLAYLTSSVLDQSGVKYRTVRTHITYSIKKGGVGSSLEWNVLKLDTRKAKEGSYELQRECTVFDQAIFDQFMYGVNG
jgi:hypothetical protein